MTILSSVTRFLGTGRRQSNRCGPRRQRDMRREVEPLEARQLMATFAATGRHDLARAAAYEPAARSSSTDGTPIVYYNADHVGIQPVSVWQGLRGGDQPGQYIITGTSRKIGLLFIGSVKGRGTTYAVKVPGASSTSVYGPDNLDGSSVRLVGSYRERATHRSVAVNGFLFQGSTNDLGVASDYQTIDYPGAKYNYVHSTMGNFAVGNYDSPSGDGSGLGPGQDYIYNVTTGSFVTHVDFPGSVADTAYGIWYNGGTSYTICGGYSDQAVNNATNQNQPIGTAFLVDWNSATGQFSNWTSYSFPGAPAGTAATHFEGISSVQPGVYTLNADVYENGKPLTGYLVTVDRNPDGSFGSGAWTNLHYPNHQALSSNSVYGDVVVGIAWRNPHEVIAYQAVVGSSS